MSAKDYNCCTLCPRECKADRTQAVGFCGMTDKMYAAKAMVHTFEEPCISGSRGSGAIFFSGCSLGCVFCQNDKLSHGKFGKEISCARLSQIMLSLQEQGVHNINLVSATHFLPSVERAVENIRGKLTIPIVWNTGGYETVEAVERLSRFCSIYLQDMKFLSAELSQKYAKSSDYFNYAMDAACKMIEKAGAPVFDSDGIMQSGVILRHLVLPSNRKDSISLLHEIKERCGTDSIVLSLMSQYTPPEFDVPYRELNRRVTDFEYKSVCECAQDIGFKGYFQQRDSAESRYTPSFDLSGL